MKIPTIEPKDKIMSIAEFVVEQNEKRDVSPRPDSLKQAWLIAEVTTKMTTDYDIEHIKGIAEVMLAGYKLFPPSNAQWTYYCAVAHHLAMGWDKEEEPEISEAWDYVWTELNKFSLKSLKGKNLEYYKEKTA